MITKEQAITADDFHLGKCTRKVGPRGGIKLVIRNWRRSGKTKIWMSRPDEFEVPVKYGMYSYGYVRWYNAEDWHLPEDCPALKEETEAPDTTRNWPKGE